jgi:hypothetical protein
MRLLATNMLIWSNVKPRFKWGTSILPIGLMFAAFVPIIAIAAWMAGALRLTNGPVRGQSNGPLWLVLFLSTTVVLMLAGYALGWVLNAAIARTILGWPAEKVRDVFLESKIPDGWREPDAPATGLDPARKRASWAVTRQKGLWHFVLARGVFGWGGAMFVGTGLMPVLMHRHEPSWSYLVSQARVSSLAGAFFGFATWWCMERLFIRQSASSGSQ